MMRTTTYARERDAEMLRRYDAGESAAALGDEFGMSTGSAMRTIQLARNAGKPKGPRGPRGPNMKDNPRLTPEQRNHLAAQELHRRFAEVRHLLDAGDLGRASEYILTTSRNRQGQ